MVSALHCFALHTQTSLFKYVFKHLYFTAVNQLRTCRSDGTYGSMEGRSEDLEHLPPHLGISIEKTIITLKVTTRQPVFFSPRFLISLVKHEPNRVRSRGFPPPFFFYFVALAGI